MRGKLLTVFEERSRQHSRKPNYAYKMIDELYPDSKKIDVFSREKRIGWDVWGNETDKFSTIDCVECGKKIDLHEEDTMGEHCLTCYWLKREVVDNEKYEGNKEWDKVRL